MRVFRNLIYSFLLALLAALVASAFTPTSSIIGGVELVAWIVAFVVLMKRPGRAGAVELQRNE